MSLSNWQFISCSLEIFFVTYFLKFSTHNVVLLVVLGCAIGYCTQSLYLGILSIPNWKITSLISYAVVRYANLVRSHFVVSPFLLCFWLKDIAFLCYCQCVMFFQLTCRLSDVFLHLRDLFSFHFVFILLCRTRMVDMVVDLDRQVNDLIWGHMA